MTLKIKDPGSALTHFIAMILALCAASPLLIKAAQAPGSSPCTGSYRLYHQYDTALCGQHHLPYAWISHRRSTVCCARQII